MFVIFPRHCLSGNKIVSIRFGVSVDKGSSICFEFSPRSKIFIFWGGMLQCWLEMARENVFVVLSIKLELIMVTLMVIFDIISVYKNKLIPENFTSL